MHDNGHDVILSRVIASGQRCCWDEMGASIPCRDTGQDGELRPGLSWPEPRFEISGDIVTDRLTGLAWMADASHFEWPMSWTEAHEAVAGLRLNRHLGWDDWRLPNRRELWSLVSFAAASPPLPRDHPFRRVFPGWYWTSTPAARNPAYAWAVQFTGGRVFFEAKDKYAFTWACRGSSPVLAETGTNGSSNRDGAAHWAAWPDPRFSIREGNVLDRLTGLTWARHADLCGTTVSWTAALEAVRGLNLESKGGGWRLPGITELESLLDMRQCDPSLPSENPFTATGPGYWSSTTSALEHDWAMVLHLGRGAIGVGVKRDPRFLVWPVSGP